MPMLAFMIKANTNCDTVKTIGGTKFQMYAMWMAFETFKNTLRHTDFLYYTVILQKVPSPEKIYAINSPDTLEQHK